MEFSCDKFYYFYQLLTQKIVFSYVKAPLKFTPILPPLNVCSPWVIKLTLNWRNVQSIRLPHTSILFYVLREMLNDENRMCEKSARKIVTCHTTSHTGGSNEQIKCIQRVPSVEALPHAWTRKNVRIVKLQIEFLE